MTTSPEHPSRPNDELQRQAWDWLRLLNAGAVRPQDAEGFKSWLLASPAHKEAFNAARLRWGVFRPVAAELLRTNPQAAEFHARTLRGPASGGRRALLGAAAAGAAAAGVAVLYPPAGLWPAPREWGAEFRTATGEQRAVVLADRVRVTLNTRTSIRRRTTQGQTTGIELLAGEAAIDLPAGTEPPFTVAAGAGRSEAGAGRFEVRHLDGKVCVTCIEGELSVEHPAGAHRLRAGQQTVYDAESLSGVAAVEPGRVSAWRQGRLVFERARLGDVLDEINRYRPGRVVLLNAEARGQTVSGTFFIASLDQTLSQLQHTFGLRARPLPGGLLILS
ncbi:anti-sigma factor VreR [Pigmentiphaga soli]|uniref:Anti-sigma factor VreR n=1 Tax=Pigmentiphaga soli TaxID=1007095 RepID=A0ABP8H007_9BURK